MTPVFNYQVSGKNVEVNMSHLVSNYHMDLTPSDVGNKDRHIVQVEEKDQQDPGSDEQILALCVCYTGAVFA